MAGTGYYRTTIVPGVGWRQTFDPYFDGVTHYTYEKSGPDSLVAGPGLDPLATSMAFYGAPMSWVDGRSGSLIYPGDAIWLYGLSMYSEVLLVPPYPPTPTAAATWGVVYFNVRARCNLGAWMLVQQGGGNVTPDETWIGTANQAMSAAFASMFHDAYAPGAAGYPTTMTQQLIKRPTGWVPGEHWDIEVWADSSNNGAGVDTDPYWDPDFKRRVYPSDPYSSGFKYAFSFDVVEPEFLTPTGRIVMASTLGGGGPVVSNVMPTAGTAIGANQALGFDVTDDSEKFRAIILVATYNGLLTREVIFDQSGFSPMFSAGSTVADIPNGYRFSLVRAGGWPAAPTITPTAIDQAGMENA